ncbi:MAG: hypothetical protein ACLP3C_02680 [Mycobacterium sp.]|uniref:hypothetical protein n=1 Tax=Mycobacterium sp. TaxID=1785 RepID=UPI003F98DEAD
MWLLGLPSRISAKGTELLHRASYPRGVAVDTAGSVYVAEENNSRVRDPLRLVAAGPATPIRRSRFVTPGSKRAGKFARL